MLCFRSGFTRAMRGWESQPYHVVSHTQQVPYDPNVREEYSALDASTVARLEKAEHMISVLLQQQDDLKNRKDVKEWIQGGYLSYLRT